jgi:hypothetical protein
LYRQVIEENRSAAEMDLYKEPTNEHAYSLAGSIVTSGEWIPWPKASFSERVAERFAGGANSNECLKNILSIASLCDERSSVRLFPMIGPA